MSCQSLSYRLTMQRYNLFLYIQTFFIKICKLFCILFVSAWKLRYYKSKNFHTYKTTKTGKISPVKLRFWVGAEYGLISHFKGYFKRSNYQIIYLPILIAKTAKIGLFGQDYFARSRVWRCISEIVHYGGTLHRLKGGGLPHFEIFFWKIPLLYSLKLLIFAKSLMLWNNYQTKILWKKRRQREWRGLRLSNG